MKVKISDLRKYYLYLVLIILFLSSDSIYGIYYNSLTPLKLFVGFACLAAIPFINIKSLLKYFLPSIAFSLLFVFICINNHSEFDVWTISLFRMISVYPLILLARSNNKSLLEEYSNVIYKISVLFIGIYLAIILFGEVIPYSLVNPSKNLFQYRNYFGIVFQLPKQSYLFSSVIYRLHGFTWEPGQYQLYLNLALYYFLFFKEYEKKRIYTLIVSIILTFSTMGVLILALQILIKILFLKKGKLFLFAKFALAIVIIVAAYSVFQEKMLFGSFEVRSLDFLKSIEAIKSNFIFGSGIRRFETTNGLLSLIADNGILSIALIVLGAYKWIKREMSIVGMIESLLFVVIILLGLMNEPIQYTAFTFALIWILLIDYVKKEDLTLRRKRA
mgnify:FL=1